jgi:hypothetical protein
MTLRHRWSPSSHGPCRNQQCFKLGGSDFDRCGPVPEFHRSSPKNDTCRGPPPFCTPGKGVRPVKWCLPPGRPLGQRGEAFFVATVARPWEIAAKSHALASVATRETLESLGKKWFTALPPRGRHNGGVPSQTGKNRYYRRSRHFGCGASASVSDPQSAVVGC